MLDNLVVVDQAVAFDSDVRNILVDAVACNIVGAGHNTAVACDQEDNLREEDHDDVVVEPRIDFHWKQQHDSCSGVEHALHNTFVVAAVAYLFLRVTETQMTFQRQPLSSLHQVGVLVNCFVVVAAAV